MNEQTKKGYEEVSKYLFTLGRAWVGTWHKKGLYIRLKRRWIADSAFKAFRWFIDQKDEDEYIYAIQFFVNVRNDMAVLDMVDYGYRRALKKGKAPKGTMPNGKPIYNIFDYIFYRWPVLGQIE